MAQAAIVARVIRMPDLFRILLLPVKGQAEDKFILQNAGHQRWCGIAFLNKRRRTSLILYKLRFFRLLTLGTFISSSDIFRHFISCGNELHLPAYHFRPDGNHPCSAYRAFLLFVRQGIHNHPVYCSSLELLLQRGLFLPLAGMLPDNGFRNFFHIGYGDLHSLIRIKRESWFGSMPGRFRKMRQRASCADKKPPP